MPRGVCITIKVNGSIIYNPINEAPTLNDLRNITDAAIQRIRGFNTYRGDVCIAFHGEAVKDKSTPINAHATKRWASALQHAPSDVLFGDVAVVIGDPALLAAVAEQAQPALL